MCVLSRYAVHAFSALATIADAPSQGRALALTGVQFYAGNHRGMPNTTGQLRLNYISALPGSCH